MSELNIGQSVGRFFPSNNAKAVDVSAKEAKFNASEQVADSQPHVLRPNLSSSAAFQQQNAQINMQLAQINNLTSSLLLKELLDFPKEIKEFFLLMLSDSLSPSELSTQDLMKTMLSSSLDLSKMSAFMQQNGKEALSKLFQMIAGFNQLGTSMKTEEMNELSAILNACVSTAGTSQAQTLKNIMLLYLPWLPLGQNVGFELEIGSDPAKGGSEDEESISILISTEKFGNLQVFIAKSIESSVDVRIICSSEFPKEEAQELFEEEVVSASSLKLNFSFEQKKALSISTERNETEEKSLPVSKSEVNVENKVSSKVVINTSAKVNPFLLLLAHSVIRIIITIDKKSSLREERLSKLD